MAVGERAEDGERLERRFVAERPECADMVEGPDRLEAQILGLPRHGQRPCPRLGRGHAGVLTGEALRQDDAEFHAGSDLDIAGDAGHVRAADPDSAVIVLRQMNATRATQRAALARDIRGGHAARPQEPRHWRATR